MLVKVSALSITAPADGTGPARVRVFANPISLSVGDAASAKAEQELVLAPEQLNGAPVPLRFVLFQTVSALGIFISANQAGQEKTSLNSIRVLGSVVPNEGAAWAKEPEAQAKAAKADWLGSKSLG